MILDPTCSARSIWFDKNHPSVIHCDIRVEDMRIGIGENARDWNIRPDVQMDYLSIPFRSNYFEMVVFDPPHLEKLGLNSWLAKKYYKLFSDWHDNLRRGFSECFRVLKPSGFLIFKWSEVQIKLPRVLELVEYPPLFGHTTGSSSKTKWVCFIKEAK